MYLKTLNIWNFRKYGIKGDSFDTSAPGLSIDFHEGVNVLIGENDSGKTAIIDAIRYVLKTQSGEFILIEEKDFHQNSSETRADELKIECIFKGFSDRDAGHFLEWLGFEKTTDDKTEYVLKVWLYAKIKDNVIYPYIRAGVNSEGTYIEGEAKELLKVVYLKPLRDALADMTHGNKSRFAQILKSHPIFKTSKDVSGKKIPHDLETKYKTLKQGIDKYFAECTEQGNEITSKLNLLLGTHFLSQKDLRTAEISLTANELSDILKQLDLILEANKSGLGSLNLLCIAAELLLYTENKNGLKLTLIEELEAHLHPQYQLRLIDFISKESQYGQFILTTHSTTLASKIPLKNLVVCKKDQIYSLGNGTQLFPSDYNFLQRFLDATKANMFFAHGLILVEGDAENLLIPTIAEVIDRPLHRYGVSVVNVGSTAFKRYVKIFQRKDGMSFDMPISIVSDLDVRSIDYYNESKDGIPEIVMSNDTFITALKNITTEIQYEAMPPYFESKSQFTTFINENKTVARFANTPKGTPAIKDQLLSIYEAEQKKKITPEIIEEIRAKKREGFNKVWNSDKIKIHLPLKWTLEYDLACSAIYKQLACAINVSEYEKRNPTKEIAIGIITDIQNEIAAKYPNATPSSDESYKIFSPLLKGDISKASTAQYLADILREDTAAHDILKTDPYIKYIIDAICHVTEPLDIREQ